MSQSAPGCARRSASVTGRTRSALPATLIPVRPPAEGPAGTALASAARNASVIVPVATLPMRTAVVAASSELPGSAPFAASTNAARFT